MVLAAGLVKGYGRWYSQQPSYQNQTGSPDQQQKFKTLLFRNMQSITSVALKQKIEDKEALQLIDVREPEEHDEFNIGGELIPLAAVVQQIEKIATDKPVIIYCRKGIRSQIAIQRLQEKFPFTNLINLIGGTEAWKKQFGDNS